MPDYGLPNLQLRINPATGQVEVTPPELTGATIDPVTGQPTQTGLGQLMVPQQVAPYAPGGQQMQAIMNAGRPAQSQPVVPPTPAPAQPQGQPQGQPSAVQQLMQQQGQAQAVSPDAVAANTSAWDKALQQLTGPTSTAFLAQLGLNLLQPVPPGQSTLGHIAQAGGQAIGGHATRAAQAGATAAAGRKEKREERALELEEKGLSLEAAKELDKSRLEREKIRIAWKNAKSLEDYRKKLGATVKAKGSGTSATVLMLADALESDAKRRGKPMTRDEAVLRGFDMVKLSVGKSKKDYVGELVKTQVEQDGIENLDDVKRALIQATADAIYDDDGTFGKATNKATGESEDEWHFDPVTGTFK